jgi:hypothetical protein
MLCVKVVKPFKIRSRGEIYSLPLGRCLEVVSTNPDFYLLKHDETDEHFCMQKNSDKIVIATTDDMANEPVDA